MVKIFYVDGHAHSRGSLRAVVPIADLSHLAGTESAEYLGHRFPEQPEKSVATTVIQVLPDEKHSGWEVGFYRLAQPPVQFEELLRS